MPRDLWPLPDGSTAPEGLPLNPPAEPVKPLSQTLTLRRSMTGTEVVEAVKNACSDVPSVGTGYAGYHQEWEPSGDAVKVGQSSGYAHQSMMVSPTATDHVIVLDQEYTSLVVRPYVWPGVDQFLVAATLAGRAGALEAFAEKVQKKLDRLK